MSRERFQDALWFKKPIYIKVYGAGGIGSWLTFFLTRAGFNVELYDFDHVEEHNLGGQMFLHQDIGELKIHAVTNTCALFNDIDFNLNTDRIKIDEHYRIYSSAPTIIISAFDNMTARKDLFNAFVRQSNKSWFIDGRLLMEQMRIYAIDREDTATCQDYALNHLFDDSEIPDLMCTMKQVSHGAAMIATHMTGFITNIVSNIYTWKDNIFQVPYIWDYVIPTNQIKQALDVTEAQRF